MQSSKIIFDNGMDQWKLNRSVFIGFFYVNCWRKFIGNSLTSFPIECEISGKPLAKNTDESIFLYKKMPNFSLILSFRLIFIRSFCNCPRSLSGVRLTFLIQDFFLRNSKPKTHQSNPVKFIDILHFFFFLFIFYFFKFFFL